MNNELARAEAKALEEYDGYGSLIERMGAGEELEISDVSKILKIPQIQAAALMPAIAETYIDLQKSIAKVTYARRNYKKLQELVDMGTADVVIAAAKELNDQLGMKKRVPLIQQSFLTIDQRLKKLTRGDNE